jgi:hypothetical protein
VRGVAKTMNTSAVAGPAVEGLKLETLNRLQAKGVSRHGPRRHAWLLGCLVGTRPLSGAGRRHVANTGGNVMYIPVVEEQNLSPAAGA